MIATADNFLNGNGQDNTNSGRDLAAHTVKNGHKADTGAVSQDLSTLSTYQEISEQYPQMGTKNAIRKRLARIKEIYPEPDLLMDGSKVTHLGIVQLLSHLDDPTAYRDKYAKSIVVTQKDALEIDNETISLEDDRHKNPIDRGGVLQAVGGEGVVNAAELGKVYQVAFNSTLTDIKAGVHETFVDEAQNSIDRSLRNIAALDREINGVSNRRKALQGGNFDLKKSVTDWQKRLGISS